MDELAFFKEITGSVCGTLKIEEALQKSLVCFQRHLPVDRLILQRYNTASGTMQAVAAATRHECQLYNTLVPISDEARKTLRLSVEPDQDDVRIMNSPHDNALVRELVRYFNVSCRALMVMRLRLDADVFGSLAVISNEEVRYTEAHAGILELVQQPFTIALVNALAHQDLVRVKNLLSDDNRFLQSELKDRVGRDIVGSRFGLKDVMVMIRRVADLDSPVLLLGETGVGKDVIAQLIHQLSPRSEQPFIGLNCGAIPDSLLDSELFGHEKGAFTGALKQRRGRLERAHNGTIFLDEIGELPLHAQVRLLRFLQDQEIERVGGEKTIRLDDRVIAATNRPLEKMVADGRFREDLWFRLNVFPITIPPLRERKSDIPDLVDHFVRLKTKELKLTSIPDLATGSMNCLLAYDWPGNVRELQNIVERAIILNPEGPLDFARILLPSGVDLDRAPEADSTDTISLLDDVVRSHIHKALVRAEGKIHGPGGAAELLGLNASTLRNRMKKLGIKKDI